MICYNVNNKFVNCYALEKQNLAPIPTPGAEGAQAVAMRISGDQAEFWGCGFFGAQDTLHDDKGRHYFKDCYIQGSIDFIFGNARSLYEVYTSFMEYECHTAGQKNYFSKIGMVTFFDL